MSEVLRRFGLETLQRETRPMLAEDFVFDPQRITAARDLRIVYQEVFLEETPLMLLRQIHLQHATQPHTAAALRMGLCWNGFRDALEVASRCAEAFQRRIPENAVVNTAERYGVGDIGFAWPWSGKGEPDVIGFVRNNVVTVMHGHDMGDLAVPLARELDEALRNLPTTNEYKPDDSGLFADVRARVGQTPRVAPGGQLDFGELPAPEGSLLFFLATSGSVNRSIERANAWYYRAGSQKGRQEITLFRVSNGILPLMERLILEVG